MAISSSSDLLHSHHFYVTRPRSLGTHTRARAYTHDTKSQMGQEHISYIMGYSNQVRIDYLCDPYQPSLDKAQKIMNDFAIGDPVLTEKTRDHRPRVFTDEAELFEHVDDIDLLIIASPNYTHTPILQRWGRHDITILVEKPVAVSQQQHDDLLRASCSPEWKARIWVAMEYRYIPGTLFWCCHVGSCCAFVNTFVFFWRCYILTSILPCSHALNLHPFPSYCKIA
jgi:hypothetical protein